MKKDYLLLSVMTLVIAAGSFYAGTQFQQQRQFRQPNTGGQFFRGERGPEGVGMGNGRLETTTAMRPVTGTIIGQDENSFTVQMEDGSSKIILLTDQTAINQTTTGSLENLTVGTEVTVFGNSNSDGSLTAQNVGIGQTLIRQIRPEIEGNQPIPSSE